MRARLYFVLNAARVMENWFFMVALILWPPGLAKWRAGDNGKIKKKWGTKSLRLIRNLMEQRSNRLALKSESR